MSAPLPIADLGRIHIDRGATVAFAELPDHSVALDGYVQGPAIDAARRRFSFDHHAGCVRHATLSTCEMTLDALRVGLDPTDLRIYVNDLDADTVLAIWLLLRPAAGGSAAVGTAIRAAGRRDALGPACGFGLVPALRWALAPMRTRTTELRSLTIPEWRDILGMCVERLDAWFLAGAPEDSAAMEAPEEPAPVSTVLHDAGEWQLVEGAGVLGFVPLYEAGLRAAVVLRRLHDGTFEYAVGKASEFVDGFDVPAVLAALRDAELLANPEQDVDRNWGGGSTIGGSPRNADGSASRLPPERVVALVERVLARSADSTADA